MASVQNIVELLFKVSDQASAPAQAVARSMDTVKTAALAASAAAAAVGGGFIYAAKKAVDLGSSFEDTSLSIAGNIQAFGLRQTFEQAEIAGVRTLARLDEMAAKLPGTTEEYVDVFKTVLPAAIGGGMQDLDKIVEFTSQYAAVAKTQMVDSVTAGSELSMILTGAAGQHVVMWRKLKPLIGTTAEEFNHLSQAIRLEKVQKALSGYNDTVKRFGDTYNAKAGEAEAHFVKIIRLASKPIFEGVVKQLTDINDWLTKNQKEVIATGAAIANSMVSAVKFLIENFDTLLKVAKNLLEVWISFKAGVVATEVTAGLFAIAGAFNAITLSATEAAAAEAAATGGLSALVGVAVGLASMAGMKLLEGKVASKMSAPKDDRAAAATAWMQDFEARAGKLAEVYFRPKYGPFGPVISQDIGRDIVKIFGEEFASYKGAQREGFIAFATKYGVDVMGELADAVGAKPFLPGGPEKAKVVIENARFDIKQAFAEGYDPDRIAAAFVESIGSTALYPGQSGFAVAGTGA